MKSNKNSSDHNRFTQSIRRLYEARLTMGHAFISSNDWQSFLKENSLSQQEGAFLALEVAKGFAHVPASHFQVGAVGLGNSGNVYLGANIEFVGMPLNQSIHAEQSLLSLAYAQGEAMLQEIYVTAFPCGHCRQFFRELVNYQTVKIYCSKEKGRSYSLLELLPHSFGPQDLKVTQSFFKDNSCALLKKHDFKESINKVTKERLLQAIQRSYAPYSLSPSGVCLKFKNQTEILGSYIESCAYNPSLSPFHMAISQAILRGYDWSLLESVTLVQLKGSSLNQYPLGVELFSKFAPQCKVKIHELTLVP